MGMINNWIIMISSVIIIGLIGNGYPVNADHLLNIDTLRQFSADSYDIMKGVSDGAQSESSTPSTAHIMAEVKKITTMIDQWDTRLKEQVDAMNKIVLLLSPLEGQDLHNITEYMAWIDELYGEFKEFVENPDSLDNETAEELTELYTSDHEQDLVGTIVEIFSMISPDPWGNYKNSLLFILAQETQKDVLKFCDGQSPQQQFNEFYSAILVTELRALTMTDFGYVIKGFKKNVSYVGDMKMTGEKFLKRIDKYLLIFRNGLKVAARHFRACDPPEGHIRGKTFYEFQRFMQYNVLNEATIISTDECQYTCGDLPTPTTIKHCDGIGCNNGVPVCQGRLSHCETLNWRADFCENTDDESRRYQWIIDGWGVHHPKDPADCYGKFYWPRSHSQIVYHCDICRCLCTDDTVSSPSYHFISLRERLSDVDDNLVIVGVKFRIINKILHMDIQEARFGGNGSVDASRARWEPPEDIHYDQEGSIRSNKFKFYKVDEYDEDEREEMIEDKDVAVLTWGARRINLDTLTAPPKHLITGVRFSRDLNSRAKSIYLEIQATPFDIEENELDPWGSVWIGPKDTSYGISNDPRIEYKGEGFRNPEMSKDNVIDTVPNTFIDVDWSSWQEDAGQTVIPLLDGRAMTSPSLTGLTSLGLYHKKQKGYGGFLTFVYEGFDISPSIKNHRLIR